MSTNTTPAQNDCDRDREPSNAPCPSCETVGEFQRFGGADPPVEFYTCTTPEAECIASRYTYDPRKDPEGKYR